tara:strand:+ start:71 stop:256 length:186 start_codon:yes stop_codon:yes gene_type:complete
MFIIVQIDDPNDLSYADVIVNELGTAIKKFPTRIEAYRFMEKMGLDEEDFNFNNLFVTRLH